MASAGKRRRVLIIVQNLPVPFDRRVWLEATTLTRAGYEVSVICPKAKQFTRAREQLEGVNIYRYPQPIDAQGAAGYAMEFLWCFACTLIKSLQVSITGPGFDVIHACNPPETYWLLGLLWRPFGKRFVFDHHDLSPEMFAAKFGDGRRLMRSGLMFLERMAFRVARVVITTNASHRQVAIDRGGLRPEQIFIVRSGPDLARLTEYPPDASWKNGKRYLLVYLGEMCVQDGVDYLVRAIKLLRDRHDRSDVHCVLVGGGPHQQAIRQYAEEQGVLDLCTFTGRVSDDLLCRILSSADLAVDPDPKTPWSDKSTMNKMMEYMFFGLPIVAFDLCENRFSAQDAAVYAGGNHECELAQLICSLLDDQERRQQMSRFGRQRLRECLSWEHSVPNLLGAYDRAFAD
jgi:glycosyltransferase involved in cell wall biosynthesis